MANDLEAGCFYYRTMAAPEHDWYLPQWLKALKASQADLLEPTGWSKAKMSKLVNGVKRYDRDVVNTLAKALHIMPYELLMHPEDAMRLRRLRDTALSIAAEQQLPFQGAAEPSDRLTGTH